MSVKVGLEETYHNSYHGIFQSYRPVKALLMYSQRRNSVMENESLNQKLPSSSWSNEAPQNIELKLTCKETYLKETATWSDMQYEADDTVSDTKYYPPKKRFLEKAEMEADQADAVDNSLPAQIRSPNDYDHLGVSTKCLKETILQYRNAFEADSNKPNTNASEFLHRTFGDNSKNNNLEAEENLNLCVQNAHDQKTEPYYRSGYKKFTLRRIEEDSSNDSNAIDTTTATEQLPNNKSELNKVNEPRGKRSRACKGVRYQQFMNDTLSKRYNKKMGPKKLTLTTEEKRSQGKKFHLKEEKHQATELSASLSTQSRRETRNSAKVAALQKHKEEDLGNTIENNKRKLIDSTDIIKDIDSTDVIKDIDSTDVIKDIDSTGVIKDIYSSSNMVLPKKRFKAGENDNKTEKITEELELKILSSPSSSETCSTRVSSPESISSYSSVHVHYKKRVSRTFAESQSSLINATSESDVNLQTLADVALRDFPY